MFAYAAKRRVRMQSFYSRALMTAVLSGACAFGQQAAPAPQAHGVERPAAVQLVRGFNPNAKPETLAPNQQGEYSIQMEQLERIELKMAAVDGYQTVNGERTTLPVGSSLKDGTFYWMVAPAFLGDFHLVFERAAGAPVHVTIKVVPQSYGKK